MRFGIFEDGIKLKMFSEIYFQLEKLQLHWPTLRTIINNNWGFDNIILSNSWHNFATLLWYNYIFVINYFLYNSQIRIACQHKICKFVKLCYEQLIYKHSIIFWTFKRGHSRQTPKCSCMFFMLLYDQQKETSPVVVVPNIFSDL